MTTRSTPGRRRGSALRYYAPTLFAGVTFEVQFNEGGEVVGKHRYD
jgi:hypothetical protein